MITIHTIHRSNYKGVAVKDAERAIVKIAEAALGTTFYQTPRSETIQAARFEANNYTIGARSYIFLVSVAQNIQDDEMRESVRLDLINLMTEAMEEVVPKLNFVIELQFTSHEETFHAKPFIDQETVRRNLQGAITRLRRNPVYTTLAPA